MMSDQKAFIEPSLISENKLSIRPAHGGCLRQFCDDYGFDMDEVLDLSTGVSPWSWPVPEIPQSIWQRLPYQSEFRETFKAASRYYQCGIENLLPVSGSQSAIECLPIFATKGFVAIPEIGYKEHDFHWRKNGHQVISYRSSSHLQEILQCNLITHAVVINPGNPCTNTYSAETLLGISATLFSRNGFLVVDEAFADARPDLSVFQLGQPINEKELNGLVVLRSIGKFFGLAGLRLGFLIASPSFVKQISATMSPWSVNSAALFLGEKMLKDSNWIERQRVRLLEESQWLLSELVRFYPNIQWKACTSFVSGFGELNQLRELVEYFAQQGIYLRLFECQGHDQDKDAIVRFGLINDQEKPSFITALKYTSLKNKKSSGLL